MPGPSSASSVRDGAAAGSGSGTLGVGLSRTADPARAAAEAAAQINRSQARFVLAFIPDRLARAPLAEALARQLPGLPVFGCSSAGQITPEGYEDDALLLLAFPRAHFRCATRLISPLSPFSIEQVSAEARRLAAQFAHSAQWNRLALIFADGLSKQEDLLVTALAAGLEDVPVFGGSAADALRFRETAILQDGALHRDAALLVLIETDLDFRGLGFDHFLPTEHLMVVTDAVPEERLVLELNGAPAAKEYARLVGCPVEALSPQVFAEHPVLVRNNSIYHVRAIQKVAETGALSFLSAIDDGLLLTLGRGREILRTLEEELAVTDAAGRAPDFILGFDCFLRKLEIGQKQLTAPASEILRGHRVLGFNTYGEQHCGVHVNQTFVGVAFFEPRTRGLA
ncbi:FIST signal transduction protein [Rhodovulum sp. BSW8]|uniref:FIST C-terminal domain-containing protein n=1 Tax=Rhodovulum visakhapatnamense TaxID=364297 RepID=A0ABS1RF05_9RHOB|nr:MULTISPECIES: FIST N-terminal domain-containing protein [Rhodovulum]MBL3569628.1 FIST C-terminal domain-containing protein [Rhodovulum visakhapatnamense]MBL3577860.1 FIST C-terminal domain-containing protein [Rhodovulum visakhapatnamense]RBO53961.1 FIST signal transduction protein [Rhodovulum sp. BSW8]